MRITKKTLAFFLLLFASASVNLSHGFCIPHRDNGVDCSTVDDIKDLKKIRDIQILKVRPMVKTLPTGTFRNFQNLTQLDLSNGVLKKIESGGFASLNNLLNLNLADNQIRNIKSGTFKGLDNLISLNLRKNEIRQLSPELLNLKSLQFIDFTGNPLECDCVTLRIRDALLNANVKISKKTFCAGPEDMKGLPLMKPETHLVCLLDDKELQMDQPVLNDEEGSGTEYEDYNDDYKSLEETSKNTANLPTLAPKIKLANITNNATGEDIFFDSEDVDKKMKKLSTVHEREQFIEGSGDMDDEGSGLEGSGMEILPHIDWKQIQEETSENNETSTTGDSTSTTHSESLFDILYNVWWPTTAPEEKKVPDLEEEQFIHVTTPSTKIETRDGINEEIITANHVPIIEKVPETKPTKESEKFMVPGEEQSNKLNESLSHESKKGMGSYVVLAVLLAVLAALIAFAAYKGDFCRNKRKENDIEDGTELKDMQKSLLEQNNVIPKVASNGNMEITPLMISKSDDGRIPENGHSKREDVIDGCDPIKPPRKSLILGDDRLLTNGTHYHDQTLNVPVDIKPPVSPDAQRVKIILQENPDSVPKTPVLITRLKPDDNLVKTP